MRRDGTDRRAGRWVALGTAVALAAAGMLPRSAGAAGSWTPETGFSAFSETHAPKAEEEYRQAVALMNYGLTRQGMRRLKRLLARNPDATWAGMADYHLGVTLFQLERYEDSFRRLERFVESSPDPGSIRIARQLQLVCAAETGGRDLQRGQSLFETLIAGANDSEMEAQSRWALADMLFDRRRYRSAADAYLEFVDVHPFHERAPDAWFRVALCQYEIARRVGRGRQHLSEAERTVTDFLADFPHSKHAGEARTMLADIRNLQALRTSEVADYYLRIRDDDHAARMYLQDVVERFPGTPEAERAKERIKELEEKSDIPKPGGFTPLPLDGVLTDRNGTGD